MKLFLILMVKLKEWCYDMNNLRLLARKKNLAREELYKIMNENEHEWQIARELLKHSEDQFIILWEAYKTDRNYIENKFFMCCDQLLLSIYEEQRTDKKFKKIYKPYYDKFQKLNKECKLLELELQSKKRSKRK